MEQEIQRTEKLPGIQWDLEFQPETLEIPNRILSYNFPIVYKFSIDVIFQCE
jgi:hypothetical protein